MFWFCFPCSLVVCNDVFAYFCGMTLGRKIFKKPFLKVSCHQNAANSASCNASCYIQLSVATASFTAQSRGGDWLHTALLLLLKACLSMHQQPLTKGMHH